jgi:hypothetical protein
MASYKYPQQRFEDDYDYFRIESIRYTPPGLSETATPFQLGSGSDSNINGTVVNTIYLPMPVNIADNNSANWEADRLNGIDATIVSSANKTLNTVNAEDLFSNPSDTLGKAAANIMDDATNAGKDISLNNREAVKQFLIAKAVGTFRNVNANSIIGRTTGKVMNPNIELLFKSPDLRSFEYQFDLTPRSSAESDIIKGLIRSLKKDSAPKTGNSRGLFISTPNVFRLSFMRGGSKHPFLNSFKICALKGMRVDYTSGTGGYRVYEDSTPVKMSMSLSFTELSPVFDDDYDGNVGGVGF